MSIDKDNSGWMLFVATGSYDDFAVRLIGFFIDETIAKDKFHKLSLELDTYKKANPRPKQENYSADDYSAYYQDVKDWRDNNSEHELVEVRYYMLEKWLDGDDSFSKQYKSNSYSDYS